MRRAAWLVLRDAATAARRSGWPLASDCAAIAGANVVREGCLARVAAEGRWIARVGARLTRGFASANDGGDERSDPASTTGTNAEDRFDAWFKRLNQAYFEALVDEIEAEHDSEDDADLEAQGEEAVGVLMRSDKRALRSELLGSLESRGGDVSEQKGGPNALDDFMQELGDAAAFPQLNQLLEENGGVMGLLDPDEYKARAAALWESEEGDKLRAKMGAVPNTVLVDKYLAELSEWQAAYEEAVSLTDAEAKEIDKKIAAAWDQAERDFDAEAARKLDAWYKEQYIMTEEEAKGLVQRDGDLRWHVIHLKQGRADATATAHAASRLCTASRDALFAQYKKGKPFEALADEFAISRQRAQAIVHLYLRREQDAAHERDGVGGKVGAGVWGGDAREDGSAAMEDVFHDLIGADRKEGRRDADGVGERHIAEYDEYPNYRVVTDAMRLERDVAREQAELDRRTVREERLIFSEMRDNFSRITERAGLDARKRHKRQPTKPAGGWEYLIEPLDAEGDDAAFVARPDGSRRELNESERAFRKWRKPKPRTPLWKL